MADAFHADFIALSAVLSGVRISAKPLRRRRRRWRSPGRQTILFVDEVHRFKAQQDRFRRSSNRGS